MKSERTCLQIIMDSSEMMEGIRKASDERTAMLVLWIFPKEEASTMLVKDFREAVQRLWTEAHSDG